MACLFLLLGLSVIAILADRFFPWSRPQSAIAAAIASGIGFGGGTLTFDLRHPGCARLVESSWLDGAIVAVVIFAVVLVDRRVRKAA